MAQAVDVADYQPPALRERGALPTYIRATGVGWALGIGRVGAVVGPAIGGVILAFHLGREALFIAAAVPPIVAVAAIVGLMRLAPARRAARLAAPA